MTTRGVVRVLPWAGEGKMPKAVSMDDAKTHLRVDHSDDDLMVEAKLRAAISGLDGPSGALNRGLISQDYAYDLPGFLDDKITLPMCGVSAVTEISFLDQEGARQTVSDGVWQLVTDNRFIAYLALKAGQRWPATLCQDAAVTIKFKSGFGASPEDMPFNVRAAILLMTGDLYRNREKTADKQAYENSSYSALLSPFRPLSV